MKDITYCTNTDCGIGSCYRHVLWADKTRPNSFADFEDCPYWGLRQEGEKKPDERNKVGDKRMRKLIDADVILEVTRNLIGETEPYGDSAIDRERTVNLDKLIYVTEELLADIEKAAVNKDRHEGSMRTMGEKAHNALNGLWSWIDAYLRGEEDE